MKIKPRTAASTAASRTAVKRPVAAKKVAVRKRASPRGKSDGNKVHIRKIGPLCPVWGARTKSGAQIKSWRTWVLWVDGDWTCETMKSFNAAQTTEIERRIERGTDIWPWPESQSPKDNYRRTELKRQKMHKWQDPSAGSNWISIPQNERQDDDDENDLPAETDSLFGIKSNQVEESTTETADSDDSSDSDDDEEEDEI